MPTRIHSFALSRFSVVMALLLTAIVLADALIAFSTHVTGAFDSMARILAPCLALTAVLVYAKHRGLTKLESVIPAILWSIITVISTSILATVTARSESPLADAMLVRCDAALGFSTPALVHFVRSNRSLSVVSTVVYSSLAPFAALSLLLSAIYSREHFRRYIVAAVTATILTAALFWFFPAMGPWDAGGFTPSPGQKMTDGYLIALRAAGPLTLNPAAAAGGVVSFPSFHAILALLAASALWRVRGARYASVILALAICLSTLTTGWHYLVDVIGGAVVALLAYTISARILSE